MHESGYERDRQQCRAKIKNLKADYKKVKDHNGVTGNGWKTVKFYNKTATIQRTPLVVTFHPCLSSLPRIAKKHLPILHTSRKLEKAIPNPPLVSSDDHAIWEICSSAPEYPLQPLPPTRATPPATAVGVNAVERSSHATPSGAKTPDDNTTSEPQ